MSDPQMPRTMNKLVETGDELKALLIHNPPAAPRVPVSAERRDACAECVAVGADNAASRKLAELTTEHGGVSVKDGSPAPIRRRSLQQSPAAPALRQHRPRACRPFGPSSGRTA